MLRVHTRSRTRTCPGFAEEVLLDNFNSHIGQPESVNQKLVPCAAMLRFIERPSSPIGIYRSGNVSDVCGSEFASNFPTL